MSSLSTTPGLIVRSPVRPPDTLMVCFAKRESTEGVCRHGIQHDHRASRDAVDP